jgi:hypothetical protein
MFFYCESTLKLETKGSSASEISSSGYGILLMMMAPSGVEEKLRKAKFQ